MKKKKACGSFFKLHEKRCFTIFTLSQSNDRLYFYEEPHNFYTFLNTQDWKVNEKLDTELREFKNYIFQSLLETCNQELNASFLYCNRSQCI